VITRRTQYELREAEKRAHILLGLLIALDNIDAVIELIRSSKDAEVAKNGLIARFSLSEVQAKAILEMRLQRLTGLERAKIQGEYDELMAAIADYNDILAREERKRQIIKEELADLRARYGDPRRTQINALGDGDLDDLSLIDDEEMIITISHEGYIKRTPLTEYRQQGRGTKGSKGASSKDGDFTEHLYSATMHNTLLIFTQKGRMYWLPVYKIQEGARDAKGKPLPNYIQIDSDDKVRAVINVKNLDDPDYIKNNFIVMCTEQGTIKKTLLEAYSNVRRTGIIAITIDETDRLLDVVMTNGDNDLVIASRSGKAVRFHETRVRPMGRTAAGVKGITLDDEADDDRVIGMVCIGRPDAQLLVISENGYGKRSPIDEYRVTNRGAKGVGTLKITEKVGALVGILQASDEDDLMVINRSGILLRTPVQAINVIGRNTQGVRIIKLREGDSISSVMTVLRDETEAADEVAEVVLTDDPTPEQAE
jgi:DNA gyrase subunit A